MAVSKKTEAQAARLEKNVADTYTAVSEMGGTVPANATSDGMAGAVRSIPQGGAVDSFNGRTGDVVPAAGDYTPEMVGAADVNHTHTPSSLGAAPANHNHDDMYYRKADTMNRTQIEEAIAEVTEGGGFSKIYLGAPTDVSITNTDEGCIIKWTDPDDVVISGSTLAKYAGTLVIRKPGSAPTSKTDGTVVADVTIKNKYKTNGLADTGLTNGTKYYYGIFPYSTDGVYTVDSTTQFTPSAILPSKATGIALANLDEAVRVTYNKPSDASTVKIVYKAGSKPTSDQDGVAVTATGSPMTISGLTNGVTYHFVVYTYNAKRSIASDDYTITPSEIFPSAATNVSIENKILAVNVSYTRPSDASSVKIVYKAGSAPTSPSDGTAVNSTSSPTNISGLVDGTTYYFVVYTYNAKRYKASAVVSVKARRAEVYAFKVNQNESNPASMISYPAGCDNASYTAAKMNFGGSFSYGSWAEAFFIKKLKVVMLSFAGAELYEINKNDYTKKAAGGNVGTEGNVMIAFPKVYFKIVDNGDNTYTVNVSDVKLDDGYKCWAHIGRNGAEQDYCYIHAYEGWDDGSRLRSLTGKTPMVSQNANTEVSKATANGTGWYTDVVADINMIQMLLMLIGKNMNSQATFGTGVSNASGKINTGTMDTKGLFWGSNDKTSGVKVFGIENFYGNIFKRIAGYINANGTQKVKMTYGTQDGSTVNGWNFDGSGYVNVGTAVSTGSQYGYIKTMKATQYGLFPQPNALSGSETTYYCDYAWIYNSAVYYAYFGGNWGDDGYVGFCFWVLDIDASYTNSNFGAALSYKK